MRKLEAIPAATPGTVTVDGKVVESITKALASASSGSVVTLGRGRYGPETETFPLIIPHGVTLVGPDPPEIPFEARKHLPALPPAVLVGTGPLIVVDAPKVHIAHLALTTTSPETTSAIATTHARDLVIESCKIEGSVSLDHTRDVTMRWCTVTEGGLTINESTDIQLTGGRITPTDKRPNAINIVQSQNIRIEALVADASTAIDAHGCQQLWVGGCALHATQHAVHLTHLSDVIVNGNHLRAAKGITANHCERGEARANGIEWQLHAISLVDCTHFDVGANALRHNERRTTQTQTA